LNTICDIGVKNRMMNLPNLPNAKKKVFTWQKQNKKLSDKKCI